MPRALDCMSITTPYLAQVDSYRDPAGLRFDGIIRYYRPDLVTKYAIQREELDAIFAHGFKFLPVFQGDKRTTQAAYYGREQGKRDADAALKKAHSLGQPAATSIAYAVDTDITDKTIEDVVAHFEPIAEAHKGTGLWVLSYGDDLVCQRLQELGLVDGGWLANAVGWRTDKKFEGWVIRQEATVTLPFGLEIDPNEVKSLAGAGFWGA